MFVVMHQKSDRRGHICLGYIRFRLFYVDLAISVRLFSGWSAQELSEGESD